ncbi:MAG: two-component regulator propeller domain-containing protein [Bdellovibrionota bacterium]
MIKSFLLISLLFIYSCNQSKVKETSPVIASTTDSTKNEPNESEVVLTFSSWAAFCSSEEVQKADPDDLVKLLQTCEKNAKKFTTLPHGLAAYKSLPSEYVRAVAQDSKSNLYVATTGGLAISTDGINFSARTTHNGIAANYIYDVVVDEKDNIYLATSEGLSISKDAGVSFYSKKIADLLGSNTVYRVFVNNGKIYAATAGGLSISSISPTNEEYFVNRTSANSSLIHNTVYSVKANGDKIYAATNAGFSISNDGGQSFGSKVLGSGGIGGNNAVNDVFVTEDGTIYLATNGLGVAISTNEGINFEMKNKVDNGLASNTVYRVFVDKNSNLWAATSAGLSSLAVGARTFVTNDFYDGLASNTVLGIYVDNGGKVYASTSLGLSTSVDGFSFVSIGCIGGLKNPQIRSTYLAENVIYAASWGGGLYLSENYGVSFSNMTASGSKLVSNSLTAILKMNGDLFVGTNGGLSILKHGLSEFVSKKIAHGLAHNNINSLAKDSKGVLYIATSAGLSVSIDGGNSFTNKLPGDVVNVVLIDANDTIYAGTNAGLYISVDGDSFLKKTTVEGLGNNKVISLFVDKQGVIYAGTIGGLSISKNSGVSFQNKGAAHGIANVNINAVYGDPDGKMYLGTNLGMYISNGDGTFEGRTTKDGLGSSTVYALFIDSEFNVYASTSGGLGRAKYKLK